MFPRARALWLALLMAPAAAVAEKAPPPDPASPRVSLERARGPLFVLDVVIEVGGEERKAQRVELLCEGDDELFVDLARGQPSPPRIRPERGPSRELRPSQKHARDDPDEAVDRIARPLNPFTAKRLGIRGGNDRGDVLNPFAR